MKGRWTISYTSTDGLTYNVTPWGELTALLNWIQREDEVTEWVTIELIAEEE